MKKINALILSFLPVLFLFSCNQEQDQPEPPEPLDVGMAEDIPADTAIAGTATFFSLREGLIISHNDSNSLSWDIAFKATTIYINGGSSGPGDGAAQIVTGLFDEIIEAPESGYQTDEEGGSGLAIPTGSGKGWYNYAGLPTHKIEPIPGVILIIRTADGMYAKVEILSYYKGNPDLSKYGDTPPTEPGRFYTFRYAVQPNGTRNF